MFIAVSEIILLPILYSLHYVFLQFFAKEKKTRETKVNMNFRLLLAVLRGFATL
jgi:hypothetical protein